MNTELRKQYQDALYNDWSEATEYLVMCLSDERIGHQAEALMKELTIQVFNKLYDGGYRNYLKEMDEMSESMDNIMEKHAAKMEAAQAV